MANRKGQRAGSRVALGALALSVLILAIGATLAFAAGAPLVSGTSFSDVTETSATLEATLNPNDRDTKYHFEYVDQAGFEANGFTGAAETPEGSVPKGKVGVPVSAPVSGLSPGTTYRFRLVASNPLGETEGPDASFATYSAPPGFAGCANDAFRKGPSAKLPDCRAYEQASPVDKNGADAGGQIFKVQASLAGDAITFQTQAPVPGGVGAQNFPIFMPRRAADGWVTQGLLPPPSYGENASVSAWTSDLAYVFDSAKLTGSDLDEKSDTAFLARSSVDGSFEDVVPYTNGTLYSFAGASADNSKFFFEAVGEPLASGAAADKGNLYLWDRDTDAVSLVGVLPDSACGSPPCTPAGGSFAGPYDWWDGHKVGQGGASVGYFTQDLRAISASGERAYFTAAGGQLYLRQGIGGPGPETVHVSASRKDNGPGGGPDPAGTRPAAFMAASRDGSVTYFTSPEKLTNDANTGPEPSTVPAIASAELDGDLADIDFLPAHVADVAVQGEHIYWADPDSGSIGRAKLDGTGIEAELVTGAGATWIAVDDEHLYWTSPGDGALGEGRIGRAELDGDAAEHSFITGANNPFDIIVNDTHIYWVNAGLLNQADTRGLFRADLEGDDVEEWGELFEPGVGHNVPAHWLARGLAIDDTYLYLTFWKSNTNPEEDGGGAIQRIELADSTKFDTVLYLGFGNVSQLRGIAVDDTHIYWADARANTIGRARIDDSGPATEIEPELVKDAGKPFGIAIDASHVYWSANQEKVVNPGNDLYSYDADTGDLTDLTVDEANPNGAEVQGVLGASEDGSHLYFVANGDLDDAGPATSGNCAKVSGNYGAVGVCNLYHWHNGATSFIVRLDATGNSGSSGSDSDAVNWAPSPKNGSFSQLSTARVSADGQTLLFRSQRQLTEYENEGVPQYYRFQVGEGLICVSCNPSGEPPLEKPTLQTIKPTGVTSGAQPVLNRVLSTDGDRVFFESPDKLVGADVNGEGGCPPTGGTSGQSYRACQDVYMWEAQGSGTCAEPGGCLHLISSGQSNEPSFFGDASASGNDVFFFTREQLVPQDRDQIQDLYDARVGGGLASQNQPPPPVPCEGQACRGVGTSPVPDTSPGTATFQGPGNRRQIPRCRKGERKVRRGGKTRCVPKRKSANRSNANRGAHR